MIAGMKPITMSNIYINTIQCKVKMNERLASVDSIIMILLNNRHLLV